MKPYRIVAIAAGVALLAAPALGQAPPKPLQPPPGEGVFCAWMVVALVAEVGDRCFAGQDPAFQKEAHASVEHFDAYVLRNSKMSRADISAFKRRQGAIGAPQRKLCQDEGIQMYRILHAKGLDNLRAMTAEATARDGPPSWGDCF